MKKHISFIVIIYLCCVQLSAQAYRRIISLAPLITDNLYVPGVTGLHHGPIHYHAATT